MLTTNSIAYLDRLQHRAMGWSVHALIGCALFAAFWITGMLINRAIRHASVRTRPSIQDVLRLAGRVALGVMLVLGLVIGLNAAGVNVTAVVASLGLTGFALGFALRDALQNVVAGMLIIVYRPFRRGDHITVAGVEGDVAEIDLRYTTIDTEGRRHLVPNATVFNSIVVIAKK